MEGTLMVLGSNSTKLVTKGEGLNKRSIAGAAADLSSQL
ncbi:unnamed protein product [Larinioides sclopetarius]|uniref:Uncharacterized protein n=1 Tax=Larinioides sclopetarius TaxID=280406 RepID=A0AAV2BSR6_9ARAC